MKDYKVLELSKKMDGILLRKDIPQDEIDDELIEKTHNKAIGAYLMK